MLLSTILNAIQTGSTGPVRVYDPEYTRGLTLLRQDLNFKHTNNQKYLDI